MLSTTIGSQPILKKVYSVFCAIGNTTAKRLSTASIGAALMTLGITGVAKAVQISNVPAYKWYHGCAPTSAASVFGYWDRISYRNLFYETGNLNLTDSIRNYIYGSPNSIADLFHTTADGGTNTEDIDNGIVDYAQYRGYEFNAWNEYYDASLTWNDLVSEIDAGRPMIFFVNTEEPNQVDHAVPVFGYEDRGSDGKWYGFYDTWGEEENIRWQRFQSTNNLWGVNEATFIQPVAGRYFKDVPDSNTFARYINLLKDWGVIDGYQDGYYRPDDYVNRGQLAKFIVKGFDIPLSPVSNIFPDVPDSNTFAEYINTLWGEGIIGGYPDGTYKPNDYVERGQLAKFLVNGGNLNLTSQTGFFSDVTNSNVFASYINTLANEGIINGYPDGTYKPGNLVTRGELAKFIVNTTLVSLGINPLSLQSAGWTQENAVMSNDIQDGWTIFNDAVSGLWYDPPTNYGFEYQTLGDSLFTSILGLPTGIDADNLFTVWVGEQNIGQFSSGQSVDFVSLLGSGVSNFRITGIDSLIAGQTFTDFPLHLAFNNHIASFKMRPFDQQQSVPEPSSVFSILGFGVVGAGYLLKQKKTASSIKNKSW